MTIDQFMDLTISQIEPLLEEIRFKKFEDLNLMSEIIHRKIAIKKPHRRVEEEFTDEDIEAFEKEFEKLSRENRVN